MNEQPSPSSLAAAREDSDAAPAANEDLTIAQSLEESLLHEERGKQTFSGINGSREVAVDAGQVATFVANYGHLHAGDFQEEVGEDWRKAFLSLADK